MANIKFTITNKKGLKFDNWQKAMGEALERIGVKMFTNIKPESLNEEESKHREESVVSSKRMEQVEQDISDILTPDEIDELVSYDYDEIMHHTIEEKREQPQSVTNYYNFIFGDSGSSMTLEQVKNLLAQTENPCHVADGGDLKADDIVFFVGDNIEEKKKNIEKVGKKLHDALKTKKQGKKGISTIIVSTMEDCFNERLIKVLPNSYAFNRVFKPYLADNIVKVNDNNYNENVVGPLNKTQLTSTKRRQH